MIAFILLMLSLAVLDWLIDPHRYGNWVGEESPSLIDIAETIRYRYFQFTWQFFRRWRQ